MRIFNLFLFLIISTLSLSQLENKFLTITYVSHWQLEDLLEFKAGDKIIFSQKCTDSAPENIINGCVYFENVSLGKKQMKIMIEFKDTVVNSIFYSFKIKDAEIFEKLGLPAILLKKVAKKDSFYHFYLDEYQVFITRNGRGVNVIKCKL